MSRTFHHAPQAVQQARAQGRKYVKTHQQEKQVRKNTTTLYFYAHEQNLIDELLQVLDSREIEYEIREHTGFPQEVLQAVVDIDGNIYNIARYEPVNVINVPQWVPNDLRNRLPLHRTGVDDKPKHDHDKHNIFKIVSFTHEEVLIRERPAA